MALASTATATSQYTIEQTAQVQQFAVNGSALPEVNFDIGESYAGRLPVSDETGAPEYFFWFVPTDQEEAKDEITVWLNGGPGCSSLAGFMEENGPISWLPGTDSPKKNPFAWSEVTNMIWIEQPGGTGFSTKGNPPDRVQNETALAERFMGFFQKFTDTFGLHHKKIYLTGESYAGQYIPYFAEAMLNANDTKHFDLTGTMIIDGRMNGYIITDAAVTYPFAEYWKHSLDIEPKQLDKLRQMHQECGYEDYLDKYLAFPPPTESFPLVNSSIHCQKLWNAAYLDIVRKNPCLSYYNVLQMCPTPFDPLGGVYGGPTGNYFARSDVQAQLNIPTGEKWQLCGNSVLIHDSSPRSSWGVLPRVIDRSERTVIVHGSADMDIIAQGNLLTIQNMTWGGSQGFQAKPSSKLYVPKFTKRGAHGNMGTTHTERGLTWAEVHLSGHMVPQFQPSTAYRLLQYLVGRIDSLTRDSGSESER